MLNNSYGKHKSLTADLKTLYDQTKAEVGDADLAHIKNVAAYSQAIKARSKELIQQGGKPNAMMRGAILGALHTLLEFSELGHNIMHGSYDHLPNAGSFHSERWVWNFMVDPYEWRVMHHQNHHPFTNIVGVDHDLGYSFLRIKPGQPWYGHHAVQLPLLWTLLLTSPNLVFSLFTGASAAKTEGRKVLSRTTIEQTLKLAKKYITQNFWKDPLSVSPHRILPTFFGNYLSTVLGYDLTVAVLFLEHHSPNVELFSDPGVSETEEEYFRRQILATSNFTPYASLDNYFKTLLEEEIKFDNPPAFNVFYGGLDTHLEHHLFPDLPCNRQREIQPLVKEICLQHGLPYNVMSLEDVVPDMMVNVLKLASPVGEQETGNSLKILTRPKELLRRIVYGAQYKLPSNMTYLNKPQFYNVAVKVNAVFPQAGNQALMIRFEKPKGWDNVTWEAGSFISVRVEVGDESLVRQYSLLKDSVEAGDFLEIAIKRVEGGRVSNYINNHIQKNSQMILVGTPQSSPDFIMSDVPKKILFLAGGVGITPILSMLRKALREAPDSQATLLYFNRNEGSIIFEQELREVAQLSGFDVHFICDEINPNYIPQGQIYQAKLSTELLSKVVADVKTHEVYVCAPPGFIAASKSMLLDLGLPEVNFHTESFTPPVVEHPTDGKDHVIHFARSGIDIVVNGGTTLLEAARLAGVNIPSGCERGLCRACVCNKLQGTTNLDEHKLEPDLRITTCNTLPRSDTLVLDI
ncbi:2Fe-2S iron-sulfur cluster binding domain-containing protein [Acinetobacter halotolerans]|uniref:2Fe-2S iron-sulfur cluster binding domain-containing protein n=1 Tax=Acinetobacter halotolerans TaxID=1752076 RepID=A0A4Q6XD81_9GAMM|nr:fatty acid desaturase [Acinetobacter halotolerans]RZF55894.1 2Fe-2S iron-sulfur cluster binding domain-containing protein [Acinetobacter halotolerans]